MCFRMQIKRRALLGPRLRLMAIAVLTMIAASTLARSAEDYFHSGADRYLDDQIDEALALVIEGLEIHENDPKLLALKELLERQQEEQDQNDEEQERDESETDETDDEEDRDEDQDRDPEEEPDSDPDQDPDSQDEEEPEPLDPEDLSLEEALQLLQSLDEDERAYRDEMRIILGDPEDVEKDW